MLAENLLNKIGFTIEEQNHYWEIKSKIVKGLDVFAKSFMLGEITWEDALDKSHEMFKHKLHPYTIDLMFLLECTGYLYIKYCEKNIPEEIFVNSMKDIKYKLDECEKIHHIFGVFVSLWYLGFLELRRFAIGRLQYDTNLLWDYDDVEINGVVVKRGDFMLKCHIPSSGPLKPDLCIKSFQTVYRYFKGKLPQGVLPIMCNSWLLYPPYREIFREDTNTGIFVRNFNIIKIKEDEVFKSDWIIFNKKYQGILEGLPNNTSMQRGFIEYIKQGKSFGSAIGLLLFDGERCIIR